MKINTDQIAMLCRMYPNDAELGREIRKKYETYWKIHNNKSNQRGNKN